MRALDAITAKTLPDTLFHYTTQEGLLGILTTNSIWATKIHYLNDSSEYQLALDLAQSILDERLGREKDEHQRDKAQCLLDNLHAIKHLNVCVCSFSEERDLLSQWMGYAGGVGGYSVGFHAPQILDQAKTEGYTLAKCVYDDGEQRALILELIEETMREDFNTIPDVADPSRPRTVIVLRTGGDFAVNLARLAPVLKSKAFREEREWRLVSRATNVHRMSFRPGRSMITPYFEFPLGGSKEKYLHNVTVGPTPHMLLSKAAVESFLGSQDVASTAKVLLSDVTYRGW